MLMFARYEYLYLLLLVPLFLVGYGLMRYFRATDNTKLSEIYAEIGQMEKTRTSVDSFPVYKDLFGGYALAALVCLMLEVLIAFILRRMPVC